MYSVHYTLKRPTKLTTDRSRQSNSQTVKVGFPIRKSPDQRVLAPPRSLSQLATSFFASQCQGIRQKPLCACSFSAKPMRGDGGDGSSRGRDVPITHTCALYICYDVRSVLEAHRGAPD